MLPSNEGPPLVLDGRPSPFLHRHPVTVSSFELSLFVQGAWHYYLGQEGVAGEKSFSQWESQASQWGRTVGDGVQFGCWDLLGPNLRETGFPASTSEHRTVLFSSGAESLSD
jgi:hypothetical protein